MGGKMLVAELMHGKVRKMEGSRELRQVQHGDGDPARVILASAYWLCGDLRHWCANVAI